MAMPCALVWTAIEAGCEWHLPAQKIHLVRCWEDAVVKHPGNFQSAEKFLAILS